MLNFILYTSISLILCVHCFAPDEITKLPGLAKQPTFRQYSGYLDAIQGRHYHYWFFESQANPEKDPVVLWLNGGPGCSSLLGLFTENGPFRVNLDHKTLSEDPNSWNTLANVLYLESPVGVGFSYSDDHIMDNNDDSTAEDNYLALESFFKRFPQFSKNDFYMTGESYSGVYIPMLALKIFENRAANKSSINLKGVAIGNGAFDFDALENTLPIMTYGSGFTSSEGYNRGVEDCCNCTTAHSQQCDYVHCKESSSIRMIMTKNINPYNIQTINSHLSMINSDIERFKSSRFYHEMSTYFGLEFEDFEQYFPKYYDELAIDYDYSLYLKLSEVREALHIPAHVRNWTECGGGKNYSYTQQYFTMKTRVQELVNKYKIGQFIVYNGVLDILCNHLSGQYFVDNLGLKLMRKFDLFKRTEQVPFNDPSGYLGNYKTFEGNVTFIAVLNAGHMVPTDKPLTALQIVKHLIGTDKYNKY